MTVLITKGTAVGPSDSLSPLRVVLAQFAPPPELTVSQWADAERILPDTSAEPGKWRTDRAPYLRGFMDAIHESGVTTIALEKSAQIGGSEALNNVLAYHMEHDPCAMLLGLPTIELAEDFSKENLDPMIADIPSLAQKVREGRVGGGAAESTMRSKLFPGGRLALVGANSPASFRRRSARIFIGDDVDGWGPELKDEGDPVSLGINRTTTYWNRRVILVSTPTLKGGRIDTWYSRSDQRRFFVPCPRCGRMDWLTFSDPRHFRIVFEHRDPTTAQIACPDPNEANPEHSGCGARIDPDERDALVARGAWRPTATAQEPGLIGFHIWEAYSPWVTIPQIAAKFLSARARGREALRVFINTCLGEGFEDQTLRVESVGLLARREDYGAEVPAGVACLTAGVDTQDDRFELLVVGHGLGDETWVIDWRQIVGDPHHPETRAELLRALQRKYVSAHGVPLPIHATFIDSAGHRTDDVYDFVLDQERNHPSLRIAAIIGRSKLSGKPIVASWSEKRHGREQRPVRLYTVNIDDAKAAIVSSLSLTTPGPGYLHLPRGVDTVDESFVAQLTAEQLVTRRTKAGIVYQEWVQTQPDNHALDCSVYALGAYRLLRPPIAQWLAEIRAHAARTLEPPPAPSSHGSAPVLTPPLRPVAAPPARRVSHSQYLAGR